VCILVTLRVRCRRRRPSGTRMERSMAWRRTASSSCTREDLFAAGKRSAAFGGRCLSEAVSTPSAGLAQLSGRERWLVSTLCLKHASFHPFFKNLIWYFLPTYAKAPQVVSSILIFRLKCSSNFSFFTPMPNIIARLSALRRFLQRACYFHSGTSVFLIIAFISFDDTRFRTHIKQ